MYTRIADYGLIGNCRSAALISKWGSIDWACFPDFDSPAVFLKILDDKKGGYFDIHPAGFYQSSQIYKENTNILKTDFFNHSGRVLLTDFMPINKKDEHNRTIPTYGWKVLRRVKSKLGRHRIRVEVKVTPDYAQESSEPELLDGQIEFFFDETKLSIFGLGSTLEVKKGTVSWEFDLEEGEEKFFAVGFFLKEASLKFTIEVARKTYQETLDFWTWWSGICRYRGVFKKEVLRSALTLKMLTFAPTGAVIAAPTTSLPEKIGGNLNWDYRYVWLRDASFAMFAFLGLGYLKEAVEFMNWLETVCLEQEGSLQIMYGLRGEKDLPERQLKFLTGYERSRPVRIGNAAYQQKQFDVFGEVLGCISLYRNSGGKLSDEMKNFVAELVNLCIKNWRQKDAGIWEPRGGEKHHTYSKLTCWIGLDRGISLAKKLNLAVNIEEWEKVRQEIKNDILQNGFDKGLNAFVDFYGGKVIDSSNLNIPLVGFLPADDPRVLSTLDITMSKLSREWFVYRTNDESDQLKAGEGAFFLSTFWVIDNLAALGRSKEAKIWLEKIIYHASPLGLYAEMFDPITKEHLGNFPQGFTHLGLINSVLNLNRAMKLGAEKGLINKSESLREAVKLMNSQLEGTLENVVPSVVKRTLSSKERRRTKKRSIFGRVFNRE